MPFWGSFTLFLVSGRNEPDPEFDGDDAVSSFPAGQLTSTAWEGWWQED
jgi:hypothetical protein